MIIVPPLSLASLSCGWALAVSEHAPGHGVNGASPLTAPSELDGPRLLMPVIQKQILFHNSYACDLGCQSLLSERVLPVLVLFEAVWQSVGALLAGRHSSTASWASSNWEPVPQTLSSSGQKLDWGLCWNYKEGDPQVKQKGITQNQN